MLDFIWLIPAIPLGSSLLLGLLGWKIRSRRVVAAVACGAVLLAFLLSALAVWQLGSLADPGGHRVSLGEWIVGGSLQIGEERDAALRVEWAFLLDGLSGLMILVVTGVGFWIHLYSVGYMWEDRGFNRYFAFLNLFTGMMLILVLGSSFPVMFVGWEGVGLCSYLLIGFWYDRDSCAQAGRKAFLVNRIGDAGFLLGMAGLFAAFGTLEIGEIIGTVQAGGGPGEAWLTALALLLFLGACGKSAQVPLFVWLPDAMAGPTPVSALIHAATMVTAGVYLVCRCAALFLAAPVALGVVAAIGVVTLLVGGIIALLQTDIKKVLAYSTVSQLGYMFLAAGVGAFSTAMFHLMTHAFFKAVLFLGAGAVIHAVGGEQDLRKMGGLYRFLPWTGTAMLLGALSMVGIPGFAGFFSKDGVLLGAWAGGHRGIWILGALGAGLTGFYIFRLWFLVFIGKSRLSPGTEPHEAPFSMRSALVVLGVLSVAGGWIGIPAVLGGGNWLGRRLQQALPASPGDHAVALPTEFLLMGAALGAGLVGLYLARRWSLARPSETSMAARGGLGHLRALVASRFYVDELYDRLVVKPFYRICRWSDRFDARVVDGLVNGSGALAMIGGHLLKLFQTGYVRNYALSFLIGAVVILWVVLS